MTIANWTTIPSAIVLISNQHISIYHQFNKSSTISLSATCPLSHDYGNSPAVNTSNYLHCFFYSFGSKAVYCIGAFLSITTIILLPFANVIESLRNTLSAVFWLSIILVSIKWLLSNTWAISNSRDRKFRTTCLSVFNTQAMRKIKENWWLFWSSAKDLSNETLLVVIALFV